jgi:glycine cleavage system transcriptional repressor
MAADRAASFPAPLWARSPHSDTHSARVRPRTRHVARRRPARDRAHRAFAPVPRFARVSRRAARERGVPATARHARGDDDAVRVVRRARKPAHGAVSRYVITSFGRDRKGIVNEVTAAVLAARGNVEESRMARLRGDFTITMLVSFVRDQSDVDAFKSDLARIEGLTTSVRASSEDEEIWRAAKTVSTHRRVLLRGNDFPGITHAFTRVLFDRDVNIESMTTDTAPAPFGTERLFLVDALVRLSAGAASIDALGASLRALERDMGLDVEILEHEPAKQLR